MWKIGQATHRSFCGATPFEYQTRLCVAKTKHSAPGKRPPTECINDAKCQNNANNTQQPKPRKTTKQTNIHPEKKTTSNDATTNTTTHHDTTTNTTNNTIHKHQNHRTQKNSGKQNTTNTLNHKHQTTTPEKKRTHKNTNREQQRTKTNDASKRFAARPWHMSLSLSTIKIEKKHPSNPKALKLQGPKFDLKILLLKP